MVELLDKLRSDYPQLEFVAGKRFCWSPAKRQVMYRPDVTDEAARYSLLHETAHGLLGHRHYTMDFELLSLEVDAWEYTRQLARRHGVTLDEDHVQDCLDTYRDWLYRRSICPSCSSKSLQIDKQPLYRCHNCQATWRVATSRFCRPYRQFRLADT